jgi:hypothetical protein
VIRDRRARFAVHPLDFVPLVDGMNVRPGRDDARPVMADRVLTNPGICRTQLVVLPDGERTWTVLDGDDAVVVPAEEFLEFMRATGRSPNTVKSYARALALWWQFLGAYGLAWDEVKVEDFGAFLTWLRSGDTPMVASIAVRPARFSEETIAVRLQAVISLYRHHHLNGVETASRLYERLLRPSGAYKPFLEHIARKRPGARQVVKVRRARPQVPPTLTPAQIDAICDACARWDPDSREWGRDAARPAAVGPFGRDGPAARRGAGLATPRLAHRPGRRAVHRGSPAQPFARGAGQGRRLPEAVCLRRA